MMTCVCGLVCNFLISGTNTANKLAAFGVFDMRAQ